LLLQVKTVKNEDNAEGETGWQIQRMVMMVTLEFSDCAKIRVLFSFRLRDSGEVEQSIHISPSLPVL